MNFEPSVSCTSAWCLFGTKMISWMDPESFWTRWMTSEYVVRFASWRLPMRVCVPSQTISVMTTTGKSALRRNLFTSSLSERVPGDFPPKGVAEAAAQPRMLGSSTPTYGKFLYRSA